MKLKVIGALILLAVAVLAVHPAAAGSSTSVQITSACVKIPPIASFTVSPASGNAPLTVNFNPTYSGVIDSYLWNFGDLSTSTSSNPVSHIYTTAGTYTPTLTVTGPCGATVTVRGTPQTITVTSPTPPTATLTPCPSSGCQPLKVKFTISTTGTPFTYWNLSFGDGQQILNPATPPTTVDHTYTPSPALTSGYKTYTANLTVVNAGGRVSVLKTIKVYYCKKPSCSFSGSPTSGNEALNVKFTDKSTGNFFDTYTLDFGDGTPPITQYDPSILTYSHIYTKVGKPKAILTLGNPLGSTSGSITITVNCPSITPSLTSDKTSGKAPLTVTFQDKSTGTFTDWKLDFGDGVVLTSKDQVSNKKYSHTYSTAKTTYTAKLTLTNDCSSSSKSITIKTT